MTKDKMIELTLSSRYKIEKKIGSGGMADVYMGIDLLLERPVAIKILHDTFAGDEVFVKRFIREAQAAGKLSHQHIVNMYDVGYDQGLHYIIMEYVPGRTLKEIIKEKGRLPIREAVKIAIAIGEGLEQAHAMGIVHCDVKPHNILITDNGLIKVTDFGIARAINSSQTMMYATSVMGSAHYLSPEQASGKGITVSTDIYSLGVVLYEMLTGRVPYQGDSPISVALKHVRERCTPPSKYNGNIPPRLEVIVMKALAKDLDKRFHSITEMIEELRLCSGYKKATAAKVEPYDFATQTIPRVESEEDAVVTGVAGMGASSEREDDALTKLSKIPQKYIIATGFILFLVAFLWGFMSIGNFWSTANVAVPDVVGKQSVVATQILQDKHLRVTVNEVSNSDIAKGLVVSQMPTAGTEVKENRQIVITVSKGAGELQMPNLIGRTVEEAKGQLETLGVSRISIVKGEDREVREGLILKQEPPARGKIEKGMTVVLTENSYERQMVKIPTFKGLTVKEAKAAVDGLHLQYQINGDDSDDAVVTAQSPEDGSEMLEGGVVNLEAKPQPKVQQGSIDITVPAGKKNQSVKIVVKDDNGSRQVYNARKNPGDRIVKEFSGTGKVRVLVYINNNLVQDQTL